MTRLWTVVAVASLGAAMGGCGGGGGAAGAGNASTVALTTPALPSGTTGVAYTAQLAASVPHAPGVFYVTGGTLPAGLTLDGESGAVSGYPRQVGAFHVELGVRDGVDTSLPPGRDATYAEDRHTYDVQVALGPPHILPQQPPAAQYRASYGYQIDVAGGTAPYSFALTGGTLPAGVAVSSTGFLGLFPTEASPTPYSFQVTVTDAHGESDTATLSLATVVLPLIIFTSNPIPEAAEGFPYDLTLGLASPGGGAPFAWTQADPAPDEVDLATIGMQVTPDGHVKDTGAGPTAVGTWTFTVKVQDEPLQTATRRLTLQVNPGPVVTSITPNRASLTGPFTVTGLNFEPGAALVFKPGATQTTITPTFVSSTELTFTGPVAKPVGAGGATPVMIKNPDGGEFTKPAAFVFPATTVAFGTKGFIPSALSSTGLDAADVDGDGLADVIHSGAAGIQVYSGSPVSTAGGLVLLRNQGGSPPTFIAQTLDVGNWYDVKFADVNVDGRIDVVAIGSNVVRTWLNGVAGPLGTFTVGGTSTTAGGYPWPSQMAIGFFNGDLIPDVVFGVPHYPSLSTNGRVYTMLGTGTGTFTILDNSTTAPVNTYGIVSLCTVDSDGNGRTEIAAGVGMNPSTGPMFNWTDVTSSGNISGWTSRGATIGPNPYYASATAMIAGDFLGVGKPSQVISFMSGSPSYSNYRVLKMFSGPSLTTIKQFTNVPSTTGKSGTAIDADFDVKTDFVLATHSANLVLYRGSTLDVALTLDASTGSPAITSPLTGRLASADLDGDGRPDLLATTSYWGGNSMAANYGSSYSHGTVGNGGSMGVVFYLNTSN